MAGGPKPFPWEMAMGVGLGLLRLSPKDFWAMTPREFASACGLGVSGGSAAPGRDVLARLMAEYPDRGEK
ncbi:MAG: rcc01693 family protein [Aliihoeflea sp.]